MAYPIGQLNLVGVKKTIYDWIRKQSNNVVEPDHIIWRDQSEPLPSRPCITMKIIDGPRPVGSQDNVSYLDDGELKNYSIGGQRELTVSIQVFGNTRINRPMAYQTALDLHSSLSKLTVQDFLRGGNVAVQDRGDVTNITALEETEYEERAQFDILFNIAQNIVDDPGTIGTVNTTPNIVGP